MDPLLACIVMAAGESTRMKSDYPKVLHEVAGEPMLSHVLEAAGEVKACRTIVILGFAEELIKPKLPRDIEFVKQKRQLGTGHALMQTRGHLKDFKGELLVLCGDTPLLRGVTLNSLVETHRRERAEATVLTAALHDPTGYDRIIRKENDLISGIIEEKKCTIYEKAVEEANGETYCFNASEIFSYAQEIAPEDQATEYYITDVIRLMIKRRKKVIAFTSEDRDEILGVNSRADLAIVNKIFHRRIAKVHMQSGVTIVDPETTFIDKQVKIGRDSVIHPFTILEGETLIGKRCQVGPGAHLISASLGDGARCREVFIKDRNVKAKKEIGPYKILGG